jgi:hypothetical protein
MENHRGGQEPVTMASRLVFIISVFATIILLSLFATRTSEMAKGFSTTVDSQPNTILLSVDLQKVSIGKVSDGDRNLPRSPSRIS